MSDEPVLILESELRRVGRVVRTVEGELVSSDGGNLPPGAQVRRRDWRVKLASSVRDSSNWRWTYTGWVQKRTAASFDGWANDPNFTSAITLFNIDEKNNGASGVVSGYDLDDPDLHVIGLLPIRIDDLVDAFFDRLPDGSPVWGFSKRNVPVVDCGGGA